MRRKRFSVEQIVAILKQAEAGVPVADLIRQAGISEQTFYRWKKQYVRRNSPPTEPSSITTCRLDRSMVTTGPVRNPLRELSGIGGAKA